MNLFLAGSYKIIDYLARFWKITNYLLESDRFLQENHPVSTGYATGTVNPTFNRKYFYIKILHLLAGTNLTIFWGDLDLKNNIKICFKEKASRIFLKFL